jgi:hypothetical protein
MGHPEKRGTGLRKMFDLVTLQTELRDFFSRKYRLALLVLASYAALC